MEALWAAPAAAARGRAQTTWEDLAIDDMDVRLKWAGLFHRKKRTPGKFMMRLKVRPICPCSGPSACCRPVLELGYVGLPFTGGDRC